MKILAFSKKFIFTLFLVLFTYFSWGQYPIYYTVTDNLKIDGINDFYEWTGSAIPIDFAVMYFDEDPADDGNPDDLPVYYELENDESYTYYTYQFYNAAGEEIDEDEIVEEGYYTLSVTGDGVIYGGTLSRGFYVVKVLGYTLTGNGSSGNPWKINDETDWITFATHQAYWASGKFVKLMSDITIGAVDGEGNVIRNGLMVGTQSQQFKGTFDGNAKQMTFYYNETSDWFKPVAPFRYINNAKIKNLKVAGEVHTVIYGASGLIGHNTGTSTTVDDVLVTTSIKCRDADAWNQCAFRCGGFDVDGSGVKFKKCIYQGIIETTNDDRNGGFCGLGSDKTSFELCLFDPNPSSLMEEGVTFANGGKDYRHKGSDEAVGRIISGYYTYETESDYFSLNGLAQGTFAYRNIEAIEDGNIGHKVTIETNVGSFDVYTPVTVKLAEDIYFYNNGNAITIDYTATYDGETVVKGTDFNTEITDSNGDPVAEQDFKEAGNYTLTITNAKANYYGYTTKTLTVVPAEASWANLQSLINEADADAVITLEYDYVARNTDITPIIIGKNITIDLDGHRIDRHLSEKTNNGQVIKINSGKTVTIKNGTITGGYNNETSSNKDGGGILNMGNLTLNNVTVIGNKCKKANENSTDATARGGGICSTSGSKLYIYGCIIRENEAQGGGGGIFSEKATTLYIDKDESDNKTYIKSNTSKDKGGGIRVNSNIGGGLATIKNCEISSNVLTNSSSASVANGGGIHNDDGTLTLENCIINNNIASKFGGGIYVLKGKVSTKDCTINHNQCYDADKLFNSRGGGVYIYSGTFEMDGGTIYDNSSNLAYGGGVFVNNNTTFKVKSDVKIYGNWRFYDDAGHYETTNVYITGKTNNDRITVTGDLEDSRIGVAKNGRVGEFTKGLGSYGDETNFTSDDSAYEITVIDGEAVFEQPDSWDPEDDEDPLHPGEYIINNTIIIDQVYDDITKITFGDNGKIIIVDGGYLNTTIENSDVNKLVIYGGQLVVPEDSEVWATMKKDIESALTTHSEHWYIISSGIQNPGLVSNTNLLRLADEFPEYDLYRFNEAVELQWENYRATEENGVTPLHLDFTTLQNGRGYLYRNANDYTINIRGKLNTSDFSYTALSYTDEEDNIFKGFNLIGNPYPFNIYKGSETSAIPNGTLLEGKYYVLNLENEDQVNYEPSGMWTLTDDGTAIPPMTGILV